MYYIDVLVPFAAGLLFFLYPDIVVSAKATERERKKKRLKIAGITLVVLAAIYLLIRLFNKA